MLAMLKEDRLRQPGVAQSSSPRSIQKNDSSQIAAAFSMDSTEDNSEHNTGNNDDSRASSPHYYSSYGSSQQFSTAPPFGTSIDVESPPPAWTARLGLKRNPEATAYQSSMGDILAHTNNAKKDREEEENREERIIVNVKPTPEDETPYNPFNPDHPDRRGRRAVPPPARAPPPAFSRKPAPAAFSPDEYRRPLTPEQSTTTPHASWSRPAGTPSSCLNRPGFLREESDTSYIPHSEENRPNSSDSAGQLSYGEMGIVSTVDYVYPVGRTHAQETRPSLLGVPGLSPFEEEIHPSEEEWMRQQERASRKYNDPEKLQEAMDGAAGRPSNAVLYNDRDSPQDDATAPAGFFPSHWLRMSPEVESLLYSRKNDPQYERKYRSNIPLDMNETSTSPQRMDYSINVPFGTSADVPSVYHRTPPRRC